MKGYRRPIEVRPTLLSRIHDRFVHGVYEDVQDYIFNKYGSPSIVYIRENQNTVRPCFPRNDVDRSSDGERIRYRGFCDFCKMVRKIFGEPTQLSPCVRNEIEYVERGIRQDESDRKDDNAPSWKWQWQRCHMGLLDYYAPIRSIAGIGGSPPMILAVLMFGHFREEGDAAVARIEGRINEVILGDTQNGPLAGLTESERMAKADLLRQLIETIPVLTNDKRIELTNTLEEIVSLVSLIATHTLRAGTLHDGDDFVKNLKFALGDVRITEAIFYGALRDGLEKIRRYVNFETAVMYKSTTLNYASLMPVAASPADVSTSSPLTVNSLAAFRKLQEYDGVSLPDGKREFDWLDPKKIIGTRSGSFFAHETVSGNLILLAFGYGDRIPKAFQRAVLAAAVNEKLIPFIDNAISTLELDILMVEVGHLLGRTRAKIQSGYDYLEDVGKSIDIRRLVKDTTSEEWLKNGEAAIEEGMVKLHLIRHNFYAFRQVRSDDVDKLPAKPIDVVALLKSQVAFFERIISTTPLLRVDYTQSCEEAVVNAVKERLELVFLNLFDNMCKFSYNDTYGTISIDKDAEHCIIEFTNLGIGVAPDENELVFQPQVKTRYNDPAKRKDGVGMGLTLCRRVIERECGGKISLRSTPANTSNRRFEGDNFLTTITVRLPLIHNRREGAMINVLFFDDYPNVSENKALLDRLKMENIQVTTAMTTGVFEQTVRQIAFDAVILDVMARASVKMYRYDDPTLEVSEEETGIELLRRLRGGYYQEHAAHYKIIPIYIRTANSDLHMQSIYEREGGQYIDPAKNKELVKMILEQCR